MLSEYIIEYNPFGIGVEFSRKTLIIVIRERLRILLVPWLPPILLSNINCVRLGQLLLMLRVGSLRY